MVWPLLQRGKMQSERHARGGHAQPKRCNGRARVCVGVFRLPAQPCATTTTPPVNKFSFSHTRTWVGCLDQQVVLSVGICFTSHTRPTMVPASNRDLSSWLSLVLPQQAKAFVDSSLETKRSQLLRPATHWRTHCSWQRSSLSLTPPLPRCRFPRVFTLYHVSLASLYPSRNAPASPHSVVHPPSHLCSFPTYLRPHTSSLRTPPHSTHLHLDTSTPPPHIHSSPTYLRHKRTCPNLRAWPAPSPWGP